MSEYLTPNCVIHIINTSRAIYLFIKSLLKIISFNRAGVTWYLQWSHFRNRNRRNDRRCVGWQ